MKDYKNESIKFIASLPPIMSAISIDGIGDGARIKLDVSRQFLDAVIQLQLLAGQSFEVTIKKVKNDYEYER